MTRLFFESAPRALAGHLFRNRVWDALKPRLHEFLRSMPDRLLRSLVERCQECIGPERQEMEDALAGFFRSQLGEPDVASLVQRDRSRLFKAWAELDPDHGLEWLRQAIETASDERLAALDGAPDGSGGWRGRRQLVWLCESLAAFGEYFPLCERILFRLAQVETEPSIGNNSTAIWKGMFVPALAFTEVPFPDRADLLLRRLSDANENTITLTVSAVVEALGPPGARMVPPAVVGGRVVPEQWRPTTYGELYRLQQDLGRRALVAIGRLSTPIRTLAQGAIVRNLIVLGGHGLIDELRGLFADPDEELRRQLRAEVRRLVEYRENVLRRSSSPPADDPILKDLRQWQSTLEAGNLAARVQDLTSLDYWQAIRGSEPEPGPYGPMAVEILGTPEVMQRLADWFDSEKSRSGFSLGIALGEADRVNAIAPIVISWIKIGRCRRMVAGYLRGIRLRTGMVFAPWSQLLDEVLGQHPDYVGRVTLDADFSQEGFRRVMRLVALNALLPICLDAFASSHWKEILGVQERAAILDLLLSRGEEPYALATALSLVVHWAEYGHAALPPDLASRAIRLLDTSLDVRIDAGAWSAVLDSLALTHPKEAADLAANALTSPGSLRVILEQLVLTTLRQIAVLNPQIVMEAIGRCLLDPRRRVFFGVLSFRGLFEAIGLPEVRKWVMEHDAEQVKPIARHLGSPQIEAGNIVIPPVTGWVMGQFGDDEGVFQEFCLGRHSFEVQVGSARDRREELERAVAPFLRHELPWVRRWAEYELKENEREAKLDAYLDDRRERM